jgi:uncharacterized protein YjbI with pentapeptide repeats
MEKVVVEEQTFEKLDITTHPLAFGKYEQCHFRHCNFANANLSGFHFTDCTFSNCNFSLANTSQTVFSEVKFKDCKLLGLHFDYCKEYPFSVTFENCLLNLSCFYQRKLKKTKFINCSLQEVDFTEADLSHVVFEDCNLLQATFDRTNLEGTDFRTAVNYHLDPEKNKLKKTKFSAVGAMGLLSKYDIEIE